MDRKNNNSSKKVKQLYLCTNFESLYQVKKYDEDGIEFTDLSNPKKEYLLRNLLNDGWKIVSQSPVHNGNKSVLNIFLLVEKYE